MIEEAAARRAAEVLFAEHRAGTTFTNLEPALGIGSIADGYAVQDRLVTLLRAGDGEPVGYKVGLTSQAMQTFCGIDHPVAGVVLARRVHRSGATVDRGAFGRLGLEFEIACRINSELPATVTTPEEVAPHVAGVGAAIEVIDDRAADYGKLDVRSLIADNAWNAGIVLGEFTSAWPDLAAVPGTATRDGTPVGSGHGRDILGHPFHSVAWLHAHLAGRGGGLRRGDVVMTGSVMKTVFPTQAGTWRFDLAGVGSVEVNVA